MLKDKGLAAPLVASALQQSRASEAERAQALWTRKFGTAPTTSAERARQLRFLVARGFDAATVHRVLRDVARGGAEPVAEPDGPTAPDPFAED